MNWYRNLYVGETFRKKKKKIIRMTEAGTPVAGLYLILLRKDKGANQLELIPQYFFEKDMPNPEAVLIVGIASGKSEAKELLVQMTDTIYRETGTAELKKYFLSQWGKIVKER